MIKRQFAGLHCFLRFFVAATVFVVAHASSSQQASASLDLIITFSGGLTPSQQAAFTQAEAFWESKLIGYKPGITQTTVTIDASGAALGPGILGQAGPTSGIFQGGYLLASTGFMEFSTSFLPIMESNGTLADVIKHEMAHVLGYGTLWTQNNVYIDGTGQYTGVHALNAFRSEFVGQSAATFIPVELGGGGGTAGSHWDEVDGGSGPSGLVTFGGRDMRDELMTGWLNTPTFVSNTTIASFEDIGFVTSVPEPSSIALVACIAIGVIRYRKTQPH